MTEPTGGNANDLDKVMAASREAAKIVRPVLGTKEGSGGRHFIGCACLIGAGDRLCVVTAHHVLTRHPGRKIVVMTENGDVTNWPKEYGVPVPRSAGIPEADLAYIVGTQTDAIGKAVSFPIEQAALDIPLSSQVSFIAIGYPASRAKVRDGTNSIRTPTFYCITHPVLAGEDGRPKIDDRTHIAVRYDRTGMNAPDGSTMMGPEPEGMSGGALFVAAATSGPHGMQITPLLAGIITEHHARENIIVAARIECLLDALSPSRSEADRTHVRSTFAETD